MTPAPWTLLAVAVLLLAVVLLADRQTGRRRAKRLKQLADRCGFRYSRVDRFGLATRIRMHLPPAAEDVHVRDLMYRSSASGQEYAFTATYGGAARGIRVLDAVERNHDGVLRDVRFADADLPLDEQYRRLLPVPSPGTPGEG
jgi:hypothetical protein